MIAIIDYQMGNLRSVQKAFEKVGAEAVVTDDHQVIMNANRVVLPGVGAFGDAMVELQKRGLHRVVQEVWQSGKPLLGICLGMQLFFDSSLEHGEHEGLGILPGTVVPFRLSSEWKVPHMGWNSVQVTPQAREHPVFAPLQSGDEHVYFVHSFFCQPKYDNITSLNCDYGGSFCAAVAHDNVLAMQFHPEKSQAVGLGLLQRFAQWQPVMAGK